MARDLARSPFPGMDPYLEQYWGDVHHALCTYSRDIIRKSLPAGLIARMDERTVIEFSSEEKRTVIPDVRIVDYGDSHGGSQGGVATVASPVDEPLIVDNELALTEGFVQVIDTRNNNRIVTVIEFASPVNKLSSPGREKYQKKRRELLDGGVSVVEIDLIRTGNWNLMASQYEIESRRPGIYHACLTRGWKAHRSEVYSMTLQQRLPTIRIPLRETDEDVKLDLQALIDQVYENGSYGFDVNYSKPPIPPLSELDQNWATTLLANKLPE